MDFRKLWRRAPPAPLTILYLGVHGILEYDEVRLLRSLGHRVLCLGPSTNPAHTRQLRPFLPLPPGMEELQRLAQGVSPSCLSPALINQADVVIAMHEPSFLLGNWPKLRRKRVIWRTIGQSVDFVEAALRPLRRQGLQIVRYSPAESRIPGFLGADAVIRFAKDPAEYGGWTGNLPRVLSFIHQLAQRPIHCNAATVRHLAERLPFDLYGIGNESLPFARGSVSAEEQARLLRSSRAYFSANTQPASYTLGFIEAWMTGIPVVAVGPALGHARHTGEYRQDTYEVHELMESGRQGYWSDDPTELERHLRSLLHDPAHAAALGATGRARAIELFGIGTIAPQWQAFLQS
jgi:hypothetical protein